ncbi:MAG: tetratricopeptide repeat protein [Pseudomonadota bacterium]
MLTNPPTRKLVPTSLRHSIGVIGLTIGSSISVAFAADLSDSAANAIHQYQQEMASVENEYGAHHYALVEPAVGLGINYQRQGRHDEAIDAFKRALHVNRINRGLHNIDHIPIIDLIATSQIQLGDWADADQQQRLRLWIHKREIQTNQDVSGEDLDSYVDAVLHYSNWQGQMYSQDTGRFPLAKLREAQNALVDARSRLEKRNANQREKYFKVLNTIAVNSYNTVVYLSSNDIDPVSGSSGGDQDMSDYLLRQNIITQNYRDGTAALAEVIKQTSSEGQRLQHAMATLNYADWMLLFNRPQSAHKEYKKAYQAFLAAGLDAQTINQRFADPQSIKSFELDANFNAEASTEHTESETEKEPKPYALAVFDVSRKGQARNIDIEESWPATDRRIRRTALVHLGATKFRPTLVNGEPTIKKGVKIRYSFPSPTLNQE